MDNAPLFSVVMSVHNGVRYLQAAIDSICGQSLADLELIVVNDGSTDGSGRLLSAAAAEDRRIVVLEQENRGLAASLNRGFALARGRYIARMDADDIATPRRLEQMGALLDRDQDVDVACTGIRFFGQRFWTRKLLSEATDPDDLRAQLLFRNCVAHPTVVIRRAVWQAAGLRYDETIRTAQDYELWSRAVERLRFRPYPIVTVNYRQHGESALSTRAEDRNTTVAAIHHTLFKRLGHALTAKEARVHGALAQNGIGGHATIDEAIDWIWRVAEFNRSTGHYPRAVIDRVCARETRRLLRWRQGHSWHSLYRILHLSMGYFREWRPRDFAHFSACVGFRGANGRRRHST